MALKLNWMTPLENNELEDLVVIKTVREALKLKIPLVGEVLFDPSGARFISVYHYDFGDDLADAEVGLLKGLVAACAKTYLRSIKEYDGRLSFLLE